MEKEVIVGNSKFIVRELLATELDSIDFSDRVQAVKKQVLLSTGMSDESYSKLTVKERMNIVSAINEVNGFSDFQQTVK